MVAGGVRTAEQALAMIEAGVDRIASSTPFDILEEIEAL
jgi:deoxyribose-phosphate aldolase